MQLMLYFVLLILLVVNLGYTMNVLMELEKIRAQKETRLDE